MMLRPDDLIHGEWYLISFRWCIDNWSEKEVRPDGKPTYDCGLPPLITRRARWDRDWQMFITEGNTKVTLSQATRDNDEPKLAAQ